MSNGARTRRWLMPTSALAVMGVLAACSGGGTSDSSSSDGAGSTEEVTIDFQQWWEPELGEGDLRGLMDEFEAANPGIKVNLLSGPYATTKEQVVAGAATGTMADVVGLDGAWVADFVKQGSIADLTAMMDTAGYDDSTLASQVQIDGATYMIPVVNFVYPLFHSESGDNRSLYANPAVDQALVEARGITSPEERVAAYQEIVRMIGDDAPALPIVAYQHQYLGSERVRGLVYSPLGICNLERCWLASD
ncbi:MAG: extracellular solute-binding protein [Cellulomonadaceae bacterium]|nr:extracellular solute-binding protein [Cellulomonadaceae bacterium]